MAPRSLADSVHCEVQIFKKVFGWKKIGRKKSAINKNRFGKKRNNKKMVEKNWLKKNWLARKKPAKTLAWHTCLASPYAKMSKKIEKRIEKKIVLFYISTLEHLFQPSLNSSVGRVCRS